MSLHDYIRNADYEGCCQILGSHFTSSELNDALFYAIEKSNIDIIKLLLDHRSDINCVKDSLTPLHTAVYYQNIAIIRLLLDFHANVNTCNLGGCSPLHSAINLNNVEIVRLLLEHHADSYKWPPDRVSNPEIRALIQLYNYAVIKPARK